MHLPIGGLQVNTLRRVEFNQALWLILMFLVSIAGVLVIKVATSHGAGLRPDSYYYLSAAENLLKGEGYSSPVGPSHFSPITNFPPLYSLTLAGLHTLGLKLYASARILSGLYFGFTIALVGASLNVGQRSSYWSLFGVLLLVSSPVLIELYSYAQSEPLYIVLCILSFLILREYVARKNPSILLWLAGIAAGGAFLTRYIGITVVLTGALVLWMQSSRLGSERNLKDSLQFCAIASFPVVVFMVRNYFVAGNLSNRPAPYFHPPAFEKWIEARDSFLGWFTPTSLSKFFSPTASWIAFAIIILLVLLILVYAILISLRPAAERRVTHVQLLLHSIYILLYCAFLLVTVFWLDAITPLNYRLFSPIIPSFLIVSITLL